MSAPRYEIKTRYDEAAYTALVVYVRSVVRQLRGVENTYNERK